MPTRRLTREFYGRATLIVARELLGQRLVRLYQGEQLAGRIVEVEAYIGQGDQACHASVGRTARNAVMFGPPGQAYVYFIYGMHYCLNIVTEAEGFPAAVLIRAVEPQAGLATMQALRPGRPLAELTRGPGRLCAALAIDRSCNGVDLCAPDSVLWVEEDAVLPDSAIAASPRIGVRGDSAALQAPWRYYLQGNPWVSGRRTSTGHR